ncbi:MAG: hypothetical protein AAB428_02690 [Patescibacteria group bacterium]
MKYIVLPLIIMSFVGVAILGSTLFDMNPNHQGDCIASVMSGTMCPTNITDLAVQHISALQSLIQAVSPSNHNWFLLLVSLFFVSVSIFLSYKNLLLSKLGFLPERLRELTLHSLYSKQRINSWLSLFELSPSL